MSSMNRRAWILGVAVSALVFTAPHRALAQAGMEAGAITGQSTGLAKHPKDAGSTINNATNNTNSKTAAATGGNAKTIPAGKPVGTTLPVRRTRPSSGAPGTLNGQVLEHGTAKPVPNVLLRLTSTEPQYVVETKLARTDSTGSWSITDVEPGRWSLAVDKERMPLTYACADSSRFLVVSKSEALHVAPFALYRTACVEGHVQWADGYVFSDAPVLVVPRRASLPPAHGRVNGVGDYLICSAPADSAMVWLQLRDGRRIGSPVSLAVGKDARVDFKPPSEETMPGTLLLLNARTASGEKVPFARMLMVGRRLGVAGEPSVVFVRDANANREGEVLTHVPFGTYEIIGWNPRQGEWGRVEQLVVARGAGDSFQHEVTMRGTSTSEEQEEWRQAMLDRADDFQLHWVP
jgi:hypothetical protein